MTEIVFSARSGFCELAIRLPCLVAMILSAALCFDSNYIPAFIFGVISLGYGTAFIKSSDEDKIEAIQTTIAKLAEHGFLSKKTQTQGGSSPYSLG